MPSWYLRGTRDAILPPPAQLAMAQRAGSTLVNVAASHLHGEVSGVEVG
jgi:hypothetical protein